MQDTTGIPLPALASELQQKYQSCPKPGAFERFRKRLAV
jgi:hypothetical protein